MNLLELQEEVNKLKRESFITVESVTKTLQFYQKGRIILEDGTRYDYHFVKENELKKQQLKYTYPLNTLEKSYVSEKEIKRLKNYLLKTMEIFTTNFPSHGKMEFVTVISVQLDNQSVTIKNNDEVINQVNNQLNLLHPKKEKIQNK